MMVIKTFKHKGHGVRITNDYGGYGYEVCELWWDSVGGGIIAKGNGYHSIETAKAAAEYAVPLLNKEDCNDDTGTNN